GYGAVLLIGLLYALRTGIAAVWADTLHYADRARHLLEQGNFFLSPIYQDHTLPLYSLLMSLGFAFPEVETGHRILVLVQVVALSITFFPLRALILNHSGLRASQASWLAAGFTLLPSTFVYASLLIPEAVFIPLIAYAVYFLDQLFAGSNDQKDAWGAAIFMALACLTLSTGAVLWLAVLITFLSGLWLNPQSFRKSVFLPVFLLPPLLLAGWAAYDFHGAWPDLNLAFNNALARFNFVKNGLLYVIFSGAPLAGLALLISAIMSGRHFWQNNFFRLAFTALVLVAFYAGLTNDVIVSHKLDYFTNRVIEPYLFLALIVFLRLDPGMRKELLGNGLLVFFVLAIFGLPGNLHVDFYSGLTLWDGSLALTKGFNVLHNIIYIVLISLPVAVLFLRPSAFMPVYIALLFLMALPGLGANSNRWHRNEDSNFLYMKAREFYYDATVKSAETIYTDYRCQGDENNDVAYLFRCFDTAKALYFLPKLPQKISDEELLRLPLNKNSNVLFLSTQADNNFGQIMAESGLARAVRVTPESLKAAASAPLVQVRKIEGMRQYVSLPPSWSRVTVLDPNSSFTLHSSAKGCITMETMLFMDDKDREISFQLNDGPVSRHMVRYLDMGPKAPMLNMKAPVSLKLEIPQGDSVLHLRYGNYHSDSPQQQDLLMFSRPVVKSCKEKS
ncbi:MAG TPA: hypothetical protein VHB73_03440, partial [Alphaproteobacteria bacterium]|nr:hypothetical protein [Alphaproteobacteria bacterium]